MSQGAGRAFTGMACGGGTRLSAPTYCQCGIIGSVGTHGLCVLPRPQGAYPRAIGTNVALGWGGVCGQRGCVPLRGVGTHRPIRPRTTIGRMSRAALLSCACGSGWRATLCAPAYCQCGTIGSVGTHGLCVLPRPQGASSRHRRECGVGLGWCVRATGLLPPRGVWLHCPCAPHRRRAHLPQGDASTMQAPCQHHGCTEAAGWLHRSARMVQPSCPHIPAAAQRA